MLKKISAFLLAAIITLAFAACGNPASADKKLTAEEIYKKAADRQQDAETADMDIGYVINVSSAGESYKIDMDMKIKSDTSDKDNIKLGMSSKMKMPELGEISMNYAYIDNMIYVETAGVKYKSAVSAADAEKIMGGVSASEMVGIESIKEAKLSKESDDNVITFKFDENTFNDIMQGTLGELSGAGGMNYKFSELNGRAVIDKDYNMKSLKMTVKATAAADGNEMVMEMEIDIKINSVGQPVSISVPSDAESYTEVSPETLTQTAA